MEYRNDLEAARLRIETLEAKLEETKAAQKAREAELAECQKERDRLRQTVGGKKPINYTVPLATGVLCLALGAALGFVAASAVTWMPKAQAPTEAPTVTVVEDGPKAAGKIHLPPEEPQKPKATTQGVATIVPPEPRASAATVGGQTNLQEAEVTIDSVVQGARRQVRDCYRTEAKTNSKAGGSVTVIFEIDRAGSVSKTQLQPMAFLEPWWNPAFATCVDGVYRSLKFPTTSPTNVKASGTYFFSAADLHGPAELGF